MEMKKKTGIMNIKNTSQNIVIHHDQKLSIYLHSSHSLW